MKERFTGLMLIAAILVAPLLLSACSSSLPDHEAGTPSSLEEESDAIRPATPDFSKPDAAKLKKLASILKKLKKELEEEAERVGALTSPSRGRIC